jgi:hypothetical protein
LVSKSESGPEVEGEEGAELEAASHSCFVIFILLPWCFIILHLSGTDFNLLLFLLLR